MFKVAVSAGHNPQAQGAVWEGVTEYDETVLWQEELLKAFDRVSDARPNVPMEAHSIATGKLGAKVREVNNLHCNLALEIHFNAAGRAEVRGCETLYYPGSANGLHVAKRVQLPLAKAMDTKSRGCKEGWYKMDRPGIVDFYGDEDGDEMPDYFLRKTNCTALILEPEFLSQIERIREKRVEACRVIAEEIGRLAKEEDTPLRRRRDDETAVPTGSRNPTGD